jgi:predicted O-methyltransferase YrrM
MIKGYFDLPHSGAVQFTTSDEMCRRYEAALRRVMDLLKDGKIVLAYNAARTAFEEVE